MGSGLILLVIVGAWLAVLVPMGLRSHDAAGSSRSVERFSDAMRVLSRRPAAPAGEVEVEPGATATGVDDRAGAADRAGDAPAGDETAGVRVPDEVTAGLEAAGDERAGVEAGTRAGTVPESALHGDEPLDEEWVERRTLLHRVGAAVLAVQGLAGRTAHTATAGWAASRRRLRTATALGTSTARRLRPGPGTSAAARRRRLLLGLVLAAVVALVAGLVGPSSLLMVAAVCGALAGLYARRCRVVARRAAARRLAAARRAAPEPTPVRVVPVAPRPARAAAEQVALPLLAEEPAPAARTVPAQASRPAAAEAPVRVPGRRAVAAAGAEWQPVPVPLPTYVTKAAAPARPSASPPRRVVRPVDPTPLDDPGALPEAPAERRRAVNGW